MNKYIWSLDISTTNIGSALWNENGELIELKHLELKVSKKEVNIEDRDIHKAEIFRKYVEDYKKRIFEELDGEITSTIVEAPLGGSNNANTVALLLGFNGMCRYILYQSFGYFPLKISVHDSRALTLVDLVHSKKIKGEIVDVLSFPKEYKDDKKKLIWDRVSKLEPQIQWYYKKNGSVDEINYDMSDSYIVGVAGLITLGIITKEFWKNKYYKILN